MTLEFPRVPSGLVRLRSLFHFITVSCYRRQPLFALPDARDLFLQSLELVRREFEFVVVGYVVMPEHVHLLLGEPNRDSISTVMQVLKQRVAKASLADSDGARHFWQTRFYDFNVFSEAKRIEKLKYIHHNPVRRGLVESAEAWRWSSYRYYALGEEGLVGVAVPVVVRAFAARN